MNQIPGLRAALKSAIKSTATEIVVHRGLARSKFVEARRMRATGDEEGAATATAAAWKARGAAEPHSHDVRGLLLAAAFLRSAPLLQLERTRSRAPAPTENQVLGALVAVLPVGVDEAEVWALRPAVAAWIKAGAPVVVPMPSAPAVAPLAEVA